MRFVQNIVSFILCDFVFVLLLSKYQLLDYPPFLTQSIQEKLKKLNEERKKEAEQRDIQRKKNDIQSAKKIQQQREQWKQDQREIEARKMEQERKEEKQRKIELKKRLEWDRKEREDAMRPVGTLVTKNDPLASSSPSPSPSPPASSVKSDKCEIQIRLPDGKKMNGTFLPTDTIQDVYAYVIQNREDGSSEPFVLMTSFPKKYFEGEGANVSLQAVGLVPRGVLLAQRRQF